MMGLPDQHGGTVAVHRYMRRLGVMAGIRDPIHRGEGARRGSLSHLHDHHVVDRVEDRPTKDRVAQPIDSDVGRARVHPLGRYIEAACKGGSGELDGHQRHQQA
jgi:hypothetical protein